MRATVSPSGSLRITVPAYTPGFMVKRMVAGSRDDLRALLQMHPTVEISDGQSVGKSHSMLVRRGSITSVKAAGRQIIVTTSSDDDLTDTALISAVRTKVIAALRREAKHHLPMRIKYLSDKHGFEFTALRFTHASSRWGSCNSKKAISLNIALMKLPFELIDYVLVHELAHTVHLNHSKEFWEEVKRVDPEFQSHRKLLKTFNPNI